MQRANELVGGYGTDTDTDTGPGRAKMPRRTHEVAMRKTPHAAAIAEAIRAGENPAKVADRYGVSIPTVRRRAIALGVHYPDRSEASRRIPLNERAFSTLTDEAEYWLGFLLADGSINLGMGRYCLQIELQAPDREHLVALRSFLGAGHDIRERPVRSATICGGAAVCRPTVQLCVSSRRLVSDLIAWGVTPRKSQTARVHEALKDSPHFWRGLVDGDGTVTRSRAPRSGYFRLVPVIKLCGASRPVIEEFVGFLDRRGIGGTGRYAIGRTNATWVASVGGSPAIALAELLYTPGCTALNRKRDIANAFRAIPGTAST